MLFDAVGYVPFSIAFFVAVGAAALTGLMSGIGLLTIRGQALPIAVGTVAGVVALAAVMVWTGATTGPSSSHLTEIFVRGTMMNAVAAFCGTSAVSFIVASRRSRRR